MKQILCFGDSNTWGYVPETKKRFPWGIRWTSILQDKLADKKIHIIEEGLCGRTTVYDCKSHYCNNPYKIAKGVELCIDELLKYVSKEKILIISPIHLGEDVWKKEYDEEFSKESVSISKKLKEEYEKVVKIKSVHFMAASDYAQPSVTDQEHLDENRHQVLAEAIYNKLEKIYAVN